MKSRAGLASGLGSTGWCLNLQNDHFTQTEHIR